MNKDSAFAYQAVYRYLVELIDSARTDGELKLPSLRQLALRLNVSVSTTKYAYALLEDEGRVFSRPKLGYFCAVTPMQPPALADNLLDNIYAYARQPGMLALCSDAPSMLLSLENPLLMTERELSRQYPRSAVPLYQPFGEIELRTVLAERYTRSTEHYWRPEQVYIGADLRSVLDLLLAALNLHGSVALVESPCSWAILRQLHAAKIRVIEVPVQADGRFDLQRVHDLLQRETVALAVFSSAVSIPHGSLMPAADKQQICNWLRAQDVWLFENDSYGEFGFNAEQSRYRDFADPEKLVVFSTFDKVIGSEAPFGYVLIRGLEAAMQRQCLDRAFRLSPIRQKALARLFGSRRIDQHTQQLRGLLQERMTHMTRLLQEHAGDQLKVLASAGGATLWAQSIYPVDMRRVYERLLPKGIVIAPGEMFSQQGLWRDCLRLSYTVDWSKDIGLAVKTLAEAIDQERQLTP
ncbi:PLP-dependent aminotransferase family protein [Pseudomonas nunensis]|uniref:PLP-dependent aminotransferase family protein n=1 Tax=Pseudomonas nunensis TaxID=2961896 RepID=A0ABY5EJF7_9PSED|nr:PLP-dependent aminotransferase family protein [Pseudomonas nunensis]KPN93286.1 GntR family transcriptional regulator [Pseudomonas nunensis]MCL5225320.1 PLP-dependent aminotransferase family protein [Pseudomonas nunensis]UTO14810.1 PLP-dependent aminotransferase family protein [Pseudomonas nunensis]